ncbi:MAG TPA: HipA domain-containing protein [Balneolaceae bacterium]
MSNQCLICSGEVNQDFEYHPACARQLFGRERTPILDYDAGELAELAELAKKAVKHRVTVPGVQAKLSLEVNNQSQETPKLTIVGLWGRFILKPSSNKWPQLPENEHCTLMMAEAVGIETVPYGLIRLKSGELAFITRRIDRKEDGSKVAMEDMAQLTKRLTEDKYKGSHEQIAKVIKRYSSNPLFDVVRFFELILFCYLTGNADMHLKNFSLLKDQELGWKLAPAYDLLSTRLLIPEKADPEELALTLNGKKSNFTKNVFKIFGQNIGLTVKQIENLFKKLERKLPDLKNVVKSSFLSDEMKDGYLSIIESRYDNLYS